MVKPMFEVGDWVRHRLYRTGEYPSRFGVIVKIHGFDLILVQWLEPDKYGAIRSSWVRGDKIVKTTYEKAIAEIL